MDMRLVAHAKPVHKLPSHLSPVQSRMDIHGGPAGQPEPVVPAGEGPVPAVQGPGGNGGEECHINARTRYPSGVPPGIQWAYWIRIPEKTFPWSPALHQPARSGRTDGAATLSGWESTAGYDHSFSCSPPVPVRPCTARTHHTNHYRFRDSSWNYVSEICYCYIDPAHQPGQPGGMHRCAPGTIGNANPLVRGVSRDQ